MKFRMKTNQLFIRVLFFFFIFFLLFLFFHYFYSTTKNQRVKAVKCNQPYGLCPAAKCIPNPSDKRQAYCWCDVINGVNYSLGNDSCEKISPYFSETGEEFIYSTFSPVIQDMGYRTVRCPPEKTNLNCMNKICSVNPNDSSKAVCVCDKTDNKGLSWITFNKNKTPTSCNYQSGASMEDYNIIKSFVHNS